MNKDQPLVSIITASYNQGAFLEAAIQSVIHQDYAQVEYILIDGGSQDGSVDIIKRYVPQLAYWVSEPDRGQAQAINKGLQRARGDILGWLNADDVLASDAVSRVAAHFLHHPEIDLVYGRVQRIDARNMPVTQPRLPANPPLFGPKTMLSDRYVLQPGSFWRRRIMEKAGMLDESYHYALDYEYWVRLVVHGAKFARLDGAPLASFRLSEGSKTSSHPDRFRIEELRVLTWLAGQPNISARLGLDPRQFQKLLRYANASANMRMALGVMTSSGHVRTATSWIWQAILTYPPIIVIRWRWIFLMLRELFRHQRTRSGQRSRELL